MARGRFLGKLLHPPSWSHGLVYSYLFNATVCCAIPGSHTLSMVADEACCGSKCCTKSPVALSNRIPKDAHFQLYSSVSEGRESVETKTHTILHKG